MAHSSHLQVSSILVVRVGALGDTLMATPVPRALKQLHPKARIDFLCAQPAVPLLDLNNNLNSVLSLQWRNVPYWISREKRRLVRQIREANYGFAVLLESAPRYRTLLKQAGVDEILDFGRTPFDPSLHSIANNLRAAGFSNWPEMSHAMDLHFSEDDRSTARELLSGFTRPVVGLHAGYGPSARKKDQANRLKGWSTGHFRSLAKLLIDSGATVVLTGSPQDRDLNESVISDLNSGGIHDLAGRTGLRALAALLSQLDLLISVDSGPAHMAAAVGCPLIVLWGPAKLQQVQPIAGTGPVTIINHNLPCAPCYDTPAMKSCRSNICMQSITPQEVFEAAGKMLTSVQPN